MPGYTGFIPGVKAENVFSTTYANNTNNSFREKIPRGHDPQGAQRYGTVTNEKFSPRSFRRIVENKDMASRRDYLEYTMSLNMSSATQRDKFLRSPYREGQPTQQSNPKTAREDPSGATISPIKYKRDLNGSPLQSQVKDVQVKPRLIERHITQSAHYQTLGDGFKRAMASDDAEDQGMRLPVVGYCGHRKGLKAENVFAKNFRDSTIHAENSLRKKKSVRSNYVAAI